MKSAKQLVFGATPAVLAAVLIFELPCCVLAQEAGRRQGPATFTTAQAAQGKTAYAETCAACHGPNLDDGEFAGNLKGLSFVDWIAKPLDGLLKFLKAEMPPKNPGSLSDDTYVDIIAFILQSNGMQPGNQELPSDMNALSSMLMPRPDDVVPGTPSPGMSPFERLPVVNLPNPLDKITPVTDAVLARPPAEEWLTWRRTYDDHGFSPLTQVNKGNVGDLQVAWSFSLPNGPNEETPLVHDGVLFLEGYGDKVQAIDAVTGNLLWQYARVLPKGATRSAKRNIAIYGNRLIVPTSDVHVVALDVKTGDVVWDQQIADYAMGARMTSGPLVAKGKVIQGTSGQWAGGNYIVGLDAETGKEAWRVNTIARPGQPGGDSWNGVPVEKRSGASVWTVGSYDPELNLVFFGTGQTYDTAPLLHPSGQPGVTNEGLYTDTTLAINPDTGQLVWYFQHVPNDQWDLDWAFEQQVINLRVNGTPHKVVFTGGKPALFDAVDAESGKYAFSFDVGLQNVVTAIDPKSGAKTINADVMPGDGKPHFVCPSMGGARSWIPTAFNPETKILYGPFDESCMDLIPVAPGGHANLSGGGRWALRTRPGTDGKIGRVEAVNLETKKVVWTVRQRAPQTSGVLATAGGVVFAGSMDRKFRAYDDSTGKVLWEAGLNNVPASPPITYSVNGKQYVAVIASYGTGQMTNFSPFVPEIHNPPDRGAAIWVFALPEKDTEKARPSH